MADKYLKLKHTRGIMNYAIYKIVKESLIEDRLSVRLIGQTYFNYSTIEKSEMIHAVTKSTWAFCTFAAEEITFP